MGDWTEEERELLHLSGSESVATIIAAMNLTFTVLYDTRFAPFDKAQKRILLQEFVHKYNMPNPVLLTQVRRIYCGNGYVPPKAILGDASTCRQKGTKWGEMHGMYSNVR